MNIPKMQSVKSSQIEALGHDPETNTLHVRFTGGAHYHYDGVDTGTFEAFKNAPSVGSHFYKNIKGKFAYMKH